MLNHRLLPENRASIDSVRDTGQTLSSVWVLMGRKSTVMQTPSSSVFWTIKEAKVHLRYLFRQTNMAFSISSTLFFRNASWWWENVRWLILIWCSVPSSTMTIDSIETGGHLLSKGGIFSFDLIKDCTEWDVERWKDYLELDWSCSGSQIQAFRCLVAQSWCSWR